MNDEALALVGRFRSMLTQAGCRGTASAGSSNNTRMLARRDVTEIAAAAEALPGAWRVETGEGDTGEVGQTLLRPLGNAVLPSFAFARRDGFITVRVMCRNENSHASSMIFGVFASAAAALDAIHNDVVTRYARGDHMAVGMA